MDRPHERMVERGQLARDRVGLEQRAVDHPNELVAFALKKSVVLGQLQTEQPARLLGLVLRTSKEEA